MSIFFVPGLIAVLLQTVSFSQEDELQSHLLGLVSAEMQSLKLIKEAWHVPAMKKEAY